jgi:hypothetical protein
MHRIRQNSDRILSSIRPLRADARTHGERTIEELPVDGAGDCATCETRTGETMFIIAQLPLADFRPLIKGGKGRLTVPDWTSDNLESGFVRGFGRISPRNGSGLGLIVDNKIKGARPVRRSRPICSQCRTWIPFTGDRGFESVSLQRGVWCEPDSLSPSIRGADFVPSAELYADRYGDVRVSGLQVNYTSR